MDKIPTTAKSTTTNGGAYVQGNVHSGNDFAGRDIIHNNSSYYESQSVSQLFQILFMISLNYLSDHWQHFAQILRDSYTHFQPNSTVTIGFSEPYVESINSYHKYRNLNPQLFVFLAANIVIGYTVNTLIPERELPTDTSFLKVIIVTATLWSFYSILLHIVCRIVSRKGTFEQTLSVFLPLFSVVYVVSSVLGFICGLLIAGLQNYTSLADSNFVSIPPISIYFCIQCVLLMYYLPILVKRIYGLGRFFLFIMGIGMGLVVVTISILSYVFTSFLFNL